MLLKKLLTKEDQLIIGILKMEKILDLIPFVLENVNNNCQKYGVLTKMPNFMPIFMFR